MKRIFLFAIITILAVGSVFAEQATLIDFSLLAKDEDEEVGDEAVGTAAIPMNTATRMDYSAKADSSYTEAQRKIMITSLAIENWDVSLASSSRNVTNNRLSYTKEAASKQYTTVMGVRVHFPVESYNSWAVVKPPFEIPAFEPKEDSEDGSSKFEGGLGVVKNVGAIKSIQVQAYGLNFPHGLSILLLDANGNEKKIFLGYMDFEGWGKIIWNNPAYQQEVRTRALRLYPIYPQSDVNLVKFGGFQISRNGEQVGGDFITYFKDVQIIYDLAVQPTAKDGADIVDEDVWDITKDREAAREKNQMKELGKKQVLRYLEGRRQATESFNADESAAQATE
ncbi:MAG: flagellar filament outer layer protein FlaA [Treponema sp.]|jgi:hypothetical protein|nr:flagellar filament outer layer protein FlaA [Treponema sp.]